MTCNCDTYNKKVHGERPTIPLPKPEWSSRHGDTILVDACIAMTVKALWNAGHITLSSCCGHNRSDPSLVLENGNNVNLLGILNVISEVDGRVFRLYQWKLIRL